MATLTGSQSSCNSLFPMDRQSVYYISVLDWRGRRRFVTPCCHRSGVPRRDSAACLNSIEGRTLNASCWFRTTSSRCETVTKPIKSHTLKINIRVYSTVYYRVYSRVYIIVAMPTICRQANALTAIQNRYERNYYLNTRGTSELRSVNCTLYTVNCTPGLHTSQLVYR